MQTKNLTPFLFSAKVTSLRPPQMQMTMIVRASFKLCPNEPLAPIESLLEQGPMTADVFRDDDEDRTGECLYASDFADFKLHAEVLLTGTCHTPGERPLAECPVRFSVGSWSKSLLVTGRRVWTEKMLGAAISEPHPFATMPLVYANGFGGPGYPKNPAGKGHGTPELPNVEHPGARVRSKGDRPEPAGFGPLSPSWPQRSGKVGTQYGSSWKKERAPFYAADFDWTSFNAAPADQQLPGYLRGDEEISFVNLHAAAADFSARLPGLRIRAFAKDAKGIVREAPMQLDTLLADLDKERLVLTWRGLAPVEQDDLADVRTVLIASEKLTDAALPQAHYLGLIEAFEANPLDLEKHMPGGSAALAALQAAAKSNAEHPERTPAERMEAALKDEAIFAMLPEDQREGMSEALAKAKESLASAKAPPEAPNQGEVLAEIVAKAGDAVKQLRALAEANGEPLRDVEEMERMLDDPQVKRMLAGLTSPKPEEIGPGKDLSGRNMMRMDLSGRDLSGANLVGANLIDANLKGARLAGANLSGAILMEANLSQADLSDANLSKAVLSSARAPGANLRRATLDMALLHEMDLEGATLAQAKCQMLVLSGSDLTGADLRGCDFFKAIAEGAILERADFTEAKLVICAFTRARAEGVTLAKAFLPNTSFADSDLRGAKLSGVRGEGTNWSRAILEKADFSFAALPAAHFMEAKAADARFLAADLRRSELYRACLDRADFRQSEPPRRKLQQGHPERHPLRRREPLRLPVPRRQRQGLRLQWRQPQASDDAVMMTADEIQARVRSGQSLAGAVLTGVDLRGRNLSGAKLAGAKLSRVSLGGADLSGSDLSEVQALSVDFAGVPT